MTQEENIFFAKRNLVDSIWKSANLEGVNVTFPETQMIIDGFSVPNKTIDDLTIILNLKRAWQYLFDTINEEISLNYIRDLNRLVGRDLVYKSGFLRTTDIRISGTTHRPSLPIDYEVENYINKILKNDDKKNSAIELMLYIMRNQLFFDGNKRTAMLTANKILIKNGLGIFAVRQQSMQDFFTKLVKFYESGESNEIMLFCKRECIEIMNTENDETEISDETQDEFQEQKSKIRRNTKSKK